MIVMKFGGSSVQDATAIRRVASIVASRLAEQPLVVVSAMGGVTDKLVQAGRNWRRTANWLRRWQCWRRFAPATSWRPARC